MSINFKNFSFNNIPIAKRLPILIIAILFTVVTIFSWISYNSLKRISYKRGKDRLAGLVSEFSATFSRQANSFLNSVNVAANSPDIIEYLQFNKTHNAAAVEQLNRLSTRADSLTLDVVLFNSKKEKVLESAFIRKRVEAGSKFKESYLIPDKGTISKFFITGNHIYWAASAPVMDNGKAIGFVVKWRLVFASQRVMQQLSKMLGSDARLLIGNNDGKLWYNLSFIVPGPPVSMNGKNGVVEYSNRKNLPVLAAAKRIPDTEWLVLFELSESKIFDSSDKYLNNILLIGILTILFGLFLTILISRNITKPLRILTKAADNIAAGNYSSIVKINRDDELGKLANSFNSMVTKVKEAQGHVQSELKQKDFLLKEIHHRVKNNLQIISSLLNLQTSSLKDRESIRAMESSRNRIKSMAIVHEMLYQKKDFVKINFKDYVQELIKNLDNSYQADEPNIIYKIEIEQIFINIDLAVSLGLIITELTSNSIKHAFTSNVNNNEITIRGYSTDDNGYRLIFSDNGHGLPENYNIEASQTVGLQLTTGLVKQIHGTMEIKNSNGCRFEITFYLKESYIESAEVESTIQA